MDKVTACLIVYKRQRHLARIVDHLSKFEFISEIIIRDNSKCENIINYGRYTSALKAENDIIYTQDDDCIVHNLQEIYDKFISEPTKICHGGTEGYRDVIKDNIYGDKQMAMFGWGTFFDRRWIGVLEKYIEKYGKDDCFYRETDRIFSILKGGLHNFVLGDIEHLEGYNGEEALSSQKEHIDFKKLAIKRALELC